MMSSRRRLRLLDVKYVDELTDDECEDTSGQDHLCTTLGSRSHHCRRAQGALRGRRRGHVGVHHGRRHHHLCPCRH